MISKNLKVIFLRKDQKIQKKEKIQLYGLCLTTSAKSPQVFLSGASYLEDIFHSIKAWSLSSVYCTTSQNVEQIAEGTSDHL